MKAKILGGAAAAIATIALALAGAPPAEAKHKPHRAPKAEAEKHKCGGKNGCPAKGETEEKAAPGAEKAGDAKPADGK
jgi:hypothetical protein